MGTHHQAHKLITVSLEKIASGRRKRSEMSLHRNLLVTTVIHRARLAIIEEDQYFHNNRVIEYHTLSSPVIGQLSDSVNNDLVTSECYTQLPMSETDGYNHQQSSPNYNNDPDLDQEMRENDNTNCYMNEMEAASVEETTAAVEEDEEDSRMDWVDNQNVFQPTGEDKENLSPAEYNNVEDCSSRLTENPYVINGGMKRCTPNINEDIYTNYYASTNKKLKTWDPNDMMCGIDQDDSTSHTLRLVSVLSASLSKPTNNTTSYTWSTPNELCRKQAKDSVDIALFVNRPAMAIAV